MISRRTFGLRSGLAAAALTNSRCLVEAANDHRLGLRYLLASCMYGYADVADVIAEAPKTGASAIDLWPMNHGNQREQVDEIGEAAFATLLNRHDVSLGCITQYKLGPLNLQAEMRLAKRLSCPLIVTGGTGPKNLQGGELKSAVAAFARQLQPHLEVAEENGVTIAIENHGSNLIESPDSMKWLMEMRPSNNLTIAFAPYHLPQQPDDLATLITELGETISVFYAWQYGMGCMKKLPKEQELLQMPGRGDLDFTPLLGALRGIRYSGWTEIFMHPVPRGVPILETNDAITTEINRARGYLNARV